MREAVDLRDGPTLWQVIAVLQRRGASGRPGAARAVAQVALDALEDAWFFGLPLADPGDEAAALSARLNRPPLRNFRVVIT